VLAMVSGRPEREASVRRFLDGCRQAADTAGCGVLVWSGVFLPPAEWLAGVRAAAGGRAAGMVLLRFWLPELMGELARHGWVPGRDVEVAYVAGGDESLAPPAGLRAVRLDHYTLGRRAARLLFCGIDGEAMPSAELCLVPSDPESNDGVAWP